MEQKEKTPLFLWSSDTIRAIEILKTRESGLSVKEAQERLAQYGKNIFENREKKSPISIFLEQFGSPLIFILIGAGILTVVLNEWIEVIVISLAVFVNAGLGFYREYHAENTLEKLISYIKDRSRVVRSGREEEIDSSELVLGDIVKLSYGSRVPADIRLLSVNNLRIDESILTGESIPVAKDIENVPKLAIVADRKNIAHAGTLVVDGFATGVVFATANNTEVGKIAGLVSKTGRVDSPIQVALKKLAWLIFFLVILIVFFIFILGISRGESVIEMLILSAAVSVGAVPEALPIALTMILSIGAERIANKKGVTRTLAASETLGSATLIMTDKTGTLTLADMRLKGVYSFNDIKNKNNTIKNDDLGLSDEEKDILSLSLLNIDVAIENPDDEKEKWTFRGRPIETNIAKSALKYGILDSEFKDTKNSLVLPFNSSNKFSIAETEKEYVIMGAPDILLKKSKMTKDEYILVEKFIFDLSDQGKRLLGIATMKKNLKNKKIYPENINDLNFKGIIAFYDPVRKETPEAVKSIEAFGAKMVMITGDLKGTAISVAREIGWQVTDDEVLSGEEIRHMSDESLLERIPDIKIFSRVTPEDKMKIGSLYRRLGEVVAMTGDGVNDAPALKAMDIGVALGSGSDVAKSAADLILLDDNFKTIALAIEEGRRVLSNIRKTFVYLMSNSLDEVFVIGGSLIFGLALPLSALQIIWVNLFTGSLPALAFSYDEDLDKERAGRHSLKSIMTKEVSFLTFGIGILTSVLLFILYYWLLSSGVELSVARSIFFVCFASYILVVAFSFRSLHRPIFSYPVFSNMKLNLAILFAVLMLILTMKAPFMRKIFDIAPLPFDWVWLIIVWLLGNIFLVEVAKFWFRFKNKKAIL